MGHWNWFGQIIVVEIGKWCDRHYNACWYRDGVSSVIKCLDQFKVRCLIGSALFIVVFKLLFEITTDALLRSMDSNRNIPDKRERTVCPRTSYGIHLEWMFLNDKRIIAVLQMNQCPVHCTGDAVRRETWTMFRRAIIRAMWPSLSYPKPAWWLTRDFKYVIHPPINCRNP